MKETTNHISSQSIYKFQVPNHQLILEIIFYGIFFLLFINTTEKEKKFNTYIELSSNLAS